MGIPANGPGSSPATMRSSMPAAAWSARSPSTATKALYTGFSLSIRSRDASVSSRALISLLPYGAGELGQRGGAEVDLGHVAVPPSLCPTRRRSMPLTPTRSPLAAPARRYPADGESPATASARSIPMGMTAGAGMVTPWST